MNAIANNTIQGEEQVRPTRTVTFQGSYDALTQSTSRDEPSRSEPSRLVGFQKDPQLQECQLQQQKAENKAANAPHRLAGQNQCGQTSKRPGRTVELE